MIRHIPEQLISQWLDGELDPREATSVQEHLNSCKSCEALEKELSEVGRLFRAAEPVQPPPYLWTRIAARLDEERREKEQVPFWVRWLPASARMPYAQTGFRAVVWVPAAMLLILVGGTIALMEHQSVTRSRMMAIAEIDRAHSVLLSLNAKTNNPFHERTAVDSGINPFAQSNSQNQSNPFRTALDRQ
jgi:anti-sigma factor RsiW